MLGLCVEHGVGFESLKLFNTLSIFDLFIKSTYFFKLSSPYFFDHFLDSLILKHKVLIWDPKVENCLMASFLIGQWIFELIWHCQILFQWLKWIPSVLFLNPQNLTNTCSWTSPNHLHNHVFFTSAPKLINLIYLTHFLICHILSF